MRSKSGSVPSSALWLVRFFGAFRLESAKETIQKFESNRAIALLVYLILHQGEPQSREVLADRIWPDADLTAARNRLKQALASLRRLLEPPGVASDTVFVADRNSIMVREGVLRTDLQEFIAADQAGDQAAFSRFAGQEFLPGLYDEWLDDLRLWVHAAQSQAQGEHPKEVIRLLESAGSDQLTRQVQLPAQVSAYFGREEETERLLQLLSEYRLVTVTGIGGTGKTRFTVHAASVASFDRVCFVPLADVDQPAAILPAMTSALELVVPPKQSPLFALRQALRADRTLLVLDNMEQLVGAETAKALRQILAECPLVTLLVSSRIPMGVESEVDFPLYPLPVPQPELSLEVVADYPVARMFVERARRSRADFQITERNFRAVMDLLRHLGGMPLAIELCAAWSHVLTPSQMLAQLQQGSELLVSRRKDTPVRQQSLLDAFATTVSLLPEEQRDLLIRLSAFRGGIRMEWLSEILESPYLSQAISGLASAALIQPSQEGESFRYTLLESLRQFASDLPDPQALRHHTQERLFELLCRYAASSATRSAIPALAIQSEGDWWHFFREEWDNVRAAIQYGIDTGRVSECVTALEHVEWFIQVDSREVEVLSWLEHCVQTEPKESEVAHRAAILLAYARRKVEPMATSRQNLESLLERSREVGGEVLFVHLWRLANLSAILGEFEACETYLPEALSFVQSAGNRAVESRIHMLRSHVLAHRGEDAAAHQALDQCADCAREAGLQNELHYVIHDRAKRYIDNGQHAAGLEVLEEVLPQEDQVYNKRLLARCYNLKGEALIALDRHTEAFMAYGDAVVRHAEVQDSAGSMYPLWNLGIHLIAQDRFRFGVQFLGAAYAFHQKYFAIELEPEDQTAFDAAGERAGDSLTPEVVAALLRRGKAMSLADCRSLALDLKSSLVQEPS